MPLKICPTCNDANANGDYEGPTCETCGGIGKVADVRTEAGYTSFMNEAKDATGEVHLSFTVIRQDEGREAAVAWVLANPAIARVIGSTLANLKGQVAYCAYCRQEVKERLSTGHHHPGAMVMLRNEFRDGNAVMMSLVCRSCKTHTDDEITEKLARDIQGYGPVRRETEH